MGVLVYPVIEGEAANWAKFESAGKPLAKVALDLEKTAKRHGVQPLYDFYSMSRDEAIAAVLGGDPGDPTSYDETKVPAEVWFEAEAGIKTVSWCSQYVEEHRSRFGEPDSVLRRIAMGSRAHREWSQSFYGWRAEHGRRCHSRNRGQ